VSTVVPRGPSAFLVPTADADVTPQAPMIARAGPALARTLRMKSM
jgi:hypothetical protein